MGFEERLQDLEQKTDSSGDNDKAPEHLDALMGAGRECTASFHKGLQGVVELVQIHIAAAGSIQ